MSFYETYIENMAQLPIDEWQESYQQGLVSFWDNNPNVAIIKGQEVAGSRVYQCEDVQINSVLNPSTGESFGDQYRKLIHKFYKLQLEWLGKYYKFDNSVWLTTNTNTRIGSLKTSILRKCNNMLKWIDGNGIFHQWDCVFTKNLTGTGFDYGVEGVPQVGADSYILVQQNAETSLIPFNQRLLFDGHAFQVKQIDNHYSDTLMTIYLFETQIQDNDDVENNIAGGIDLPKPQIVENKILPNVVKIVLGKTQAFEVYKYVNGTKDTDTFSVVASGLPSTAYNLTIIDGNHFSVENLSTSNVPLVVECTNNQSRETVSISLTMGGLW